MEAISPKLPRRLGRYDVIGKLAMGGMAEILLGRLTGPSGFERPVVIKRILPHLHGLSEFTAMFLDEGRIAARIGHPNVVQVQELTEDQGELFLVMEYLEGEAAAGLARRARARRRRIDPALCLYIVAEACAGLHAAHELLSPEGEPLDVVHRDVSPQNLFVGYDGRVKVLDFGIAKAAGRIASTEAGMLKGKFEYMSPEQAQGQRLDRRSDIFALGIVLYELSTQRRLFKRGSQTETLRAVADDTIVPPSELDPAYPAALERVCLKALARDPDDRYATAIDMRRDLLGALRALDGPAMPEEALAELMRELFSDRIEDKREMLSRMRDGLTPSHVPTADVEDAELPTLEAELQSAVRTRPAIPARPSGAGRAAAALGLVGIAVAVGIGAYALSVRDVAPTATRPEPAGIGETPPPVAEVEIVIESEPSGARVVLDGSDRGQTPLTIPLERSEEELSLRLLRDGYEPMDERIRPTVAQRIRLSLDAIEPTPRAARRRRRAAPATATEPAQPPPTDDSTREREFRRFN